MVSTTCGWRPVARGPWVPSAKEDEPARTYTHNQVHAGAVEAMVPQPNTNRSRIDAERMFVYHQP